MKARPTGSRDALLCPQASRLVNRNPQTLTTLSPSEPLSNQGSTCPAPPSEVTPVSSQLTVPSLSNVNNGGRDRSSSVKRKAADDAAAASAKVIVLASVTPDLVRSITDNKKLVDKIMEEVSDENFVTGTNGPVVALLSKISLALNSQHELISNVVSEIESLKISVAEKSNQNPASTDISYAQVVNSSSSQPRPNPPPP
jgi:hypothetical protein